jgi:hypothetical protein
MARTDSHHTTNPSIRRTGVPQCTPVQPLDVEFDSKTFLPLIRLAVVAVQKD